MGLFPGQRDALRAGARPGPGLALFALLLLFGVACGIGGVVLSASWLVADSRVREGFVEDGLVAPGSWVEGWLDTSGDGSLRDGCLLADGALVRWSDRNREAAVSLQDATITTSDGVLTVAAMGDGVRCPLPEGPEAEAFVALVSFRSQHPAPRRAPVEPTDPRLRRHLGLDEAPPTPPSR